VRAPALRVRSQTRRIYFPRARQTSALRVGRVSGSMDARSQAGVPRRTCHLWFGGDIHRCPGLGHVLQFVTRCSITPKLCGWEREHQNFRWKQPTAMGF
jgi:hypothetical protein